MVHFRHQTLISVTSSSPQQISVNPTQYVEVDSTGNGYITITFSRSIPQSLSQFAITNSNQVKIPVVGNVKLNLLGISSIQATGQVVVKIVEEANGIIEVPSQVEFQSSTFNHSIAVNVSNGSIKSVSIDGQQNPPTNIIHVGFDPITFVGSGISFLAQDYDPITGNPAGNQLTVNLLGGASESEYPSGSQLVSSRTGFISISNINGNGYFNIFKAKPIKGYT